MTTNDDDTPAGEIRAVAEGVYDELSQVIDKREATEGADECLEESCNEPSNAAGDEEFLRQLAEMDNSVHSDMRPESTWPSCQPDTHEWFVFSTSLAQVWIMVHCRVCRSIGTVKYPTTAEWDTACDAASKPYRWVDNSRVTILSFNLTDRNENGDMQPYLAEAFDMLCRLLQGGGPIPDEIVVPLEDDNELTWKTAGLLEAVKQRIEASA